MSTRFGTKQLTSVYKSAGYKTIRAEPPFLMVGSEPVVLYLIRSQSTATKVVPNLPIIRVH